MFEILDFQNDTVINLEKVRTGQDFKIPSFLKQSKKRAPTFLRFYDSSVFDARRLVRECRGMMIDLVRVTYFLFARNGGDCLFYLVCRKQAGSFEKGTWEWRANRSIHSRVATNTNEILKRLHHQNFSQWQQWAIQLEKTRQPPSVHRIH